MQCVLKQSWIVVYQISDICRKINSGVKVISIEFNVLFATFRYYSHFGILVGNATKCFFQFHKWYYFGTKSEMKKSGILFFLILDVKGKNSM